jgi:hypothetical protein
VSHPGNEVCRRNNGSIEAHSSPLTHHIHESGSGLNRNISAGLILINQTVHRSNHLHEGLKHVDILRYLGVTLGPERNVFLVFSTSKLTYCAVLCASLGDRDFLADGRVMLLDSTRREAESIFCARQTNFYLNDPYLSPVFMNTRPYFA